MASFPVVQTTSSGSNNLTDTHSVTLPSSIVAGEKLLVFFATEGGTNGNTNTPIGWTKEAERIEDSGADAVRLVIYSKTAVGSDTLTVTTNGSVDSAYTCYRVVTDNDIEVSALVDGNDTNPNPPSHTPTGGSQSYLWVAAIAFQSGTVSAYPTNYTSNQLTDTAESYNIASAVYAHEDSTEDPATFTTTSGRWVAATVAIEEQDSVIGTPSLLTMTGSIYSGTISYGATGTLNVLNAIGNVFTPSARAETKDAWVNETKPSTSWTNETL